MAETGTRLAERAGKSVSFPHRAGGDSHALTVPRMRHNQSLAKVCGQRTDCLKAAVWRYFIAERDLDEEREHSWKVEDEIEKNEVCVYCFWQRDLTERPTRCRHCKGLLCSEACRRDHEPTCIEELDGAEELRVPRRGELLCGRRRGKARTSRHSRDFCQGCKCPGAQCSSLSWVAFMRTGTGPRSLTKPAAMTRSAALEARSAASNVVIDWMPAKPASPRGSRNAQERGKRDAGVSANRMCACCGGAMEQNEPGSYVTSREYCAFCGREPLCKACSNFIFGLERIYDVRWGMLTFRAAGATPRTATGPERAELVICCRCRGGIDHRTERAETPIPIGPYTQEGWRLCPRCTITRTEQDDGRTFWRYSCPDIVRDRSWCQIVGHCASTTVIFEQALPLITILVSGSAELRALTQYSGCEELPLSVFIRGDGPHNAVQPQSCFGTPRAAISVQSIRYRGKGRGAEATTSRGWSSSSNTASQPCPVAHGSQGPGHWVVCRSVPRHLLYVDA